MSGGSNNATMTQTSAFCSLGFVHDRKGQRWTSGKIRAQAFSIYRIWINMRGADICTQIMRVKLQYIVTYFYRASWSNEERPDLYVCIYTFYSEDKKSVMMYWLESIKKRATDFQEMKKHTRKNKNEKKKKRRWGGKLVLWSAISCQNFY